MSTTKNGTAYTEEITATLCSDECRYLKDFKEFLSDLTKDAAVVTNKVGGGGGGGDAAGIDGCVAKSDSLTTCNGGELRSMILTRNNNDTYPLSGDELQAELAMCVWQQVKVKHCPQHFLVGVAKLAEEEITRELENAKVQEELESSKSSPISVEAGGGGKESKCFDLLKLQKFIGQYVEKLLLRLSDNSKEEHLKNYADCMQKYWSTKEEAMRHNIPVHAVAAVKNKPRKMEDRHVCLPRFSDIFKHQQQYSFYGVFDGHSGSLAATYATNQIPFIISKHLKEISRSPHQEETDYYREVLEASFIAADHNFTKKSLGSGTTAVCALLKSNPRDMDHLYVAWVGDSRCLLVSPTVALQLVKPHKPDSMDERKRIESTETGGAVIFAHGQWRVNGIINVSRSIGDFSVKAVIAEPDFVDVPLQPSHDFLVLGSDGLCDHVPDTDIVKCVYKALIDTQQSIEDIPKHLVELAKQGDSQDNITVVVVLLKQRSNIIDNYTKSMTKSV